MGLRVRAGARAAGMQGNGVGAFVIVGSLVSHGCCQGLGSTQLWEAEVSYCPAWV